MDSRKLRLGSPGLKIIKIIPSKRFGGSWTCDEGDGVQPAYSKQAEAISYARRHDEAGKNIVEKIPIHGGIQYGQPQE